MVNIPVVNAPYLDVDGLQIAITGDETATVQAGRARNSTNVNDIILESAATLLNTVNGVNGLDTGTVGNHILYGLYVIGDSTNVNSAALIMSANQTTPLLPPGYDMFRLIGYLRTDGSADFVPGVWSGKANDRIFTYDTYLGTPITAGDATTATAVSLNLHVPPIEGTPVYIHYDMTPAAASRILTLQYYGATAGGFTATSQVTAVHVTGIALVQSRLLSNVPNIQYFWSAGGGDAVALSVSGYQYTI